MKKYIYYLIIFLFLLFPSTAFAIVNPTDEFYVNDYANILSSETEEYIVNKSKVLNNVDGTQIVVVTVPNLDGNSLEEYANELFNSWGIGDSEKNNGLLLFLALEEREFRVEVGDGLGGILSDGKTGRFQDEYIIPYLRDNNWDAGIKNGYNAFYSEIIKENKIDLTYTEPTSTSNSSEINSIFAFVIFVLELFSPFFSFILVLVGVFFAVAIKNIKKKEERDKKTMLYFIVWFIATIFTYFASEMLVVVLMANLMFFIVVRFNNSTGSGSSYSGSYRSSSSRSHSSRSSSSSRSSGGGGRSSGGGSSRRF